MKTPAIIENNKQGLFVIGSLLLVIGGTAYYWYKKGQEKPTIKNLPSDQQSTGGVTNQPTDNKALELLAQEIERDCAGINWFDNHDVTIYERALVLSNTDFVQLYNIWNSLYQKKYTETLTEFLKDQDAVAWSPFLSVQNAMLNKLYSLDLT